MNTDCYKAYMIADRAHKGQVDKAGEPYILHPLYVMSKMHTEEEAIVAILHDVIEDTACTLDDLRKAGFSENVLESLRLLTHDPKAQYMNYIMKIKDNPIARNVKIADLKHNMDLTRIPHPAKKDYERVEKYKAALQILEH